MGRHWNPAIVLSLVFVTSGLGQDRPVELPPLLTPPPSDAHPVAPLIPRGPAGEYDHGYLYLPQIAPSEVNSTPTCGPWGRWWIDAALELVWTKPSTLQENLRLRLPTLMGGTIPGLVLPLEGLQTTQFQSGFELTVGRWFGETNHYGVDASFLTLGGTDQTFLGYALGSLVVFPNGANSSAPQVMVLPPPLATSIVTVFPTTLSTWYTAADVNYRHNLICRPSARIDAIAGYRFAYLQDELYLGEPPNSSADTHGENRAMVSNPFHGGQIGLTGEVRADRWYVMATAKVAFGMVTPAVCATGLFIRAEGVRTVGGRTLLATLSSPTINQFAVLPMLNVTLGRQLGQHTRLFAGYSFQYLSHVGRIGEVLNANLNTLSLTDYWVQSVNLGVEIRF
jgi:hypothetical protein